MKSKIDARVVKGMIFAGCSFTWGQGLYYYSNLPSLDEPPPDQYDPKMIRETHLKFAERIRYPRLVAQYFDTFELVHPHNGGSNQGAVNWWKDCFNHKLQQSDISYLVFQFTQWERDNFKFEIDGKQFNLPFHACNQEENKKFFLKFLEREKLSLDSWIEQYIRSGFEYVKSFLIDCESYGIKTLVHTWPSEYLRLIDNDPWLKERLIEFEYKGIRYRSIEDLMHPGTMQNKGYNPELTIKWDENEFEITPKDHHPSPSCHKVIAENIITCIQKYKND